MHRHTAVVYLNKMYLYGGKVSVFQNSNKLYSYDFESNEWELIEHDELIEDLKFPLYLDSHNAEIYGKEMLVFGGFIGGCIAQYSRSVLSYNFEENKWGTYYLQNPKEKSQKNSSSPKQRKPFPKKRANSGTGIYKDTLYVFGGTNGKKKLMDMWKFELLTKKWSEILPNDLAIFPDVLKNFIL